MTKSTSSAKSTSSTARPSSSVGSRKIVRDFMSGASVLALVVAGCALLPAGSAHADPSITWSGDVSPTPEPGTTNWQPTGTVVVRNGGTLNVSGGATTAFGSLVIGGQSDGLTLRSTLNVDGPGSTVNVVQLFSGNLTNVAGSAVNAQVNITNGGYLHSSSSFRIGYVSNFNSSSGVLVSGAGSILNTSQLVLLPRQGLVNHSADSSVDVKILDGGFIKTKSYLSNFSSVDGSIGRLKTTIDGLGSTLSANNIKLGDPNKMIDNPSIYAVIDISNGGKIKSDNLFLYGVSAVVNIGASVGQAAIRSGTLDVKNVAFDGKENSIPTINFNQTDTTKTTAVFEGLGNINQIAGDTVFTGDSKDFTGAVSISGGALHLGDGGTTGSIAGNIVNNGSLIFDHSNAVTSDNVISGSGKLVQQGAGTLTLTEANTYSGGTEINAGAIAFDSSVELGSGAITLNGGALNHVNTAADTLAQAFNFGQNGGTIQSDFTLTLNGALSGTGAFNKAGGGDLVLNGDGSAFTGLTSVNAGVLTVHGSVGGDVSVASGAILDGDGTIMGNATVSAGGILLGTSGQQMTFTKNLTVDSGAETVVALAGYSGAAMFDVKGDLTLGGKISVTDAGGFGVGIYNIYHYDGQLTNNNVTIGTLPNGVAPADITLQTSQAHQINIVNNAGGTLGFWDGANTTGDGTIHGGDGTWTANGTNWTNADGSANAALADGGFAVFMGAAGKVTVDDPAGSSIKVQGMQFAVDGYNVVGNGLELVDGNNAPIINVGDGSQASAQMTAIIDSTLSGTHGLQKRGGGTLVLSANNTYTGDTTISQGTLQLGNGGAEGGVTGDIINNGTLVINRSDDLRVSNGISGTGDVVKKGNNRLTLDGSAKTFSGGLTVEAGTVIAGRGNTLGNGNLDVKAGATVELATFRSTVAALMGGGTVHTTSGQLVLAQNVDSIFSGQVNKDAGNTVAALVKGGTGTLALTGDNHANLNVTGGILQIGNGGTTGSIKGDIFNLATLAFNRTDSLTYDGVISGNGLVSQLGTGTTILTGENTYTGGTTIRQGT